MKYSQLSPKAQHDLQAALEFLRSTRQGVGKLPSAIANDSVILQTHVQAVLGDADLEGATPYTKRLFGYLLGHISPANADLSMKYTRDSIAEANSADKGVAGRTSCADRVGVPDDLVEAWRALTPQQRGDLVTEGLRARAAALQESGAP